MKWKTAFTAKEASEIAADIEWFYTLSSEGQASVLDKRDSAYEELFEKEPLSSEAEFELEEIKQQIRTEEAIYKALLDEIVFADSSSQAEDRHSSPLVIMNREQRANDDNRIDPAKSKVSGESLAEWFWGFDKEIAEKFDLDIESKMEATNDNQSRDRVNSENMQPARKTVNLQLKLIYALSTALAGGSLTGIKNKDAEIVMAALASKGINCPICKRTLSDYLDEGKEF